MKLNTNTHAECHRDGRPVQDTATIAVKSRRRRPLIQENDDMNRGIRQPGLAALGLALAAALAAVVLASRETVDSAGAQGDGATQPLLVVADRMFDGTKMTSGQAVLIRDGKIAQVGPRASIGATGARQVHVPGGTILPGFIDTHTHHLVNGVPPNRALEHGVTTARDLGGPVAGVHEHPGQLRQIRSGPIVTAQRGYPLPVFGKGSGTPIRGPKQARGTVRRLVAGGASVISISLEPGGSRGAPWSHHTSAWEPPWPTLDERELKAIVAEAHRLKRRVTAYLSGPGGVRRALDAGVDEWAHMPCDRLPRKLIRRAGRSGVVIAGTLDTLTPCTGVAANARALVHSGATLLYGTDMGHVEIPHGIDAQEIHQMLNAGMSVEAALAGATSRAGKRLGLAPLGRVVPGAPADLIGVGGDPRTNLKTLEYPSLVIAGGHVAVERAPDSGGSPHHP